MKYIGMLVAALVSLIAIEPVVLAPSTDVQATASVEEYCDIAAAPNINFGTLIPAQTSADQTTTVSEPTGNMVVTPDIFGTAWTGTGINPPTMPVTQTHWALSDDPYENMNDLNLSPGESLGDTIGPGDDAVVHFKLKIPNGQTADSYTQTITFSITC